MNHNVQLFINGCLTLKFSGSWKTVICSVSLYSLFGALPLGGAISSAALPPSGEIGMVSRGTGEDGLASVLGVLRFVMVGKWECYVNKCRKFDFFPLVEN